MDDDTPLRDLLAFGPSGLVVRDMDHPRVRRLKRSRLSYSAASSFLSCPARWAIDSLLVSIPDPFAENELGTSAHKVLELLFQLPPEERTTARASDILNKLVRTNPTDICFPADPIQQGAWRSEVALRIAGLWRIEDPHKVGVISTEMAFGLDKTVPVTIGEVPVIGFIDRVDRIGDGDESTVRVVDFKSGVVKKPFPSNDSHGDQLRGYALAYKAVSGVMPTKASVYYVRHGKSRDVNLSPETLHKVERKFDTAWKKMRLAAETGEFPCTPSPLCHWCPLATVCPAAIAEGRNKPHRKQTPEEFAAITTIGEQIQLPVLSPSHSTLESDMTDRVLTHPVLTEDKSWEELAAGHLNPNAYASGAAYGLVELAVETLDAAEVVKVTTISRTSSPMTLYDGPPWDETDLVDKTILNASSHAAASVINIVTMAVGVLERSEYKITPRSVLAMSATLLHIVNTAQRELVGTVDLQVFSHTRLCEVLAATLLAMPYPPLYATGRDEMDAWVTRVIKRLNSVGVTAVRLWREGPGERPWAAFVRDEVSV